MIFKYGKRFQTNKEFNPAWLLMYFNNQQGHSNLFIKQGPKCSYVAKGGNTATGTNAEAAIKAKDKLNVGISELLGKPPPPATPTAADPPVATPLEFDRLF